MSIFLRKIDSAAVVPVCTVWENTTGHRIAKTVERELAGAHSSRQIRERDRPRTVDCQILVSRVQSDAIAVKIPQLGRPANAGRQLRHFLQ
jgi:hypothetical protein